MNLRQLRYFCHVVDSGYSISAAARTLHTSQPGISRQLALLDSQLGSSVFARRGNRIVGMTETGRQVLQVARRMLNDARSLQRIGEGYSPEDSGRFVVGTTHTHARYVLPAVVRKFTQRYPIITLDASFAGGRKVLQGFAQAGLKPSVVMSAIDADVIKAYVALGLGVAILPTLCYAPDRDRDLRARDAKDLFEPTVACIQLRRNDYLPQYMLDFIQLLAPQWTNRAVKEALETGDVPRRPVAELVKQAYG